MACYYKRRTGESPDNDMCTRQMAYGGCVSCLYGGSVEVITHSDPLDGLEQMFDQDSPYVFYDDKHGFCINTEDAIKLFRECFSN